MPPQLPLELIELCMSLVDSGFRDKSTLAAICASCKTGQKIATPLLYRSLGWMPVELDAHKDMLPRLKLLCRTILTAPELCMHVRSIRQFYLPSEDMAASPEYFMAPFEHLIGSVMGGWLDDPACPEIYSDDSDEEDSEFEFDCPYEDEDEDVEIFHDSGLPEPNRTRLIGLKDLLRRKFQNEQLEHAYLLLIAMHCPSLAEVNAFGALGPMADLRNIHQLGHNRHEPLTPFYQAPGNKRMFFDRVVEVQLRECFAPEDCGMSVEQLGTVLELPTLRTLYVSGLRAPYGDTYYQGDDQIVCGCELSKLTLTDYSADMDDMVRLLEAVQDSLEDLTIEFHARKHSQLRTDWVELDAALGACKHLHSLRIADSDVFDNDSMSWELFVEHFYDFMPKRAPAGPTVSLGNRISEMTKLKRLEITRGALFGWERNRYCDFYDPPWPPEDDARVTTTTPSLGQVLPPSLTNLTLRSPIKLGIWDEFEELLKDPRAESLDKLTLQNCSGFHWISKTEGEGGAVPQGQKRPRTVTDAGPPAIVVPRLE